MRDRLATAEHRLSEARAALRLAERRFSVADDRVAKAERALDAARAGRDQARRERYAARQARDRAGLAVDRLKRRAGDLSGHLGRMPPLAHGPVDPWRHERPPAGWQGAGARCEALRLPPPGQGAHQDRPGRAVVLSTTGGVPAAGAGRC